MTPKQRVLAEHPKAVCMFDGYTWGVVIPYKTKVYSWRTIGRGNSPRAAWADAARRMET